MVAHWLAELDGRSVTVEVPGSSANLGAGFDCLGVALAIVDRIEVEVRGWSRGQIQVSVDGEGRDEVTEDRDNRFVRGLEAAMGAARGELPEGVGWRIDMHNEIPIARGLGSSAAATVAGIVAANALLGGPLDTATQLRIAAGIEGHPDNAAAALLGGFVASAATPDGVEAIRIDAPRDLRAVLFVPERRLSTEAMRKALRGRRRQPRGGRARRRGHRHRSDRPPRSTDGRSHPRAVPRGGLPRIPADGRGSARGRSDRGVPVRRRLEHPRLRRFHGRHLPGRGRVRGCRRRQRSRRTGPGRRATERRRESDPGGDLMGGLGSSVGEGIGGLVGGAFDAIGAGLRGIVAAGERALPGGLLWAVIFVLLVVVAWTLARR